MLQKCPTCCENALRRCKNALNMQKYRNFTIQIIIIIIIIIIVIIIIIIVIIHAITSNYIHQIQSQYSFTDFILGHRNFFKDGGIE